MEFYIPPRILLQKDSKESISHSGVNHFVGGFSRTRGAGKPGCSQPWRVWFWDGLTVHQAGSGTIVFGNGSPDEPVGSEYLGELFPVGAEVGQYVAPVATGDGRPPVSRIERHNPFPEADCIGL